jgi:hypothetical protein
MSRYTLLCFIDGDKNPFKVTIPIDSDISDLKKSIKEKRKILENFEAEDLILWKVCYFW